MKKHILITGASKGIGRETACFLAKKGHTITALARSESNLESLKKLYPANINTLKFDITEKKAGILFNHLEKHTLKIDGLIHNAGLLLNKSFTELTDEDWQKQIDVNLLSVVRLTRNLLPYFNQNSHLLHISSMGGFQGSSKFQGLSAYSVSKGALAILSECLSGELSEYNISSNTLCLGAVQTEMLEKAFPGLQAPVTSGEMGEYIGEFILTGHRFYNGKILPVAISNPG
ncbi:MAG: SDR family oxidoreductase [Balneolaceae bacterium]